MRTFVVIAFFFLSFFFIHEICTAQVPTNGLVAYYPFNSNANDAIGTNHGSVNGASLTTDRKGISSSAYSFNGTDNYIEVPNSASFNISGPITLSVWLNSNSISSQRIIDKTTVSGADAWMIDLRPGGQIRFIVANAATDQPHSNVVYTNTNTWYHFVATYDNSNVKFYKDGVLVNYVSRTGSSVNNTNPLRFGANSLLNGDWFNGKMDDIRIYNRTLSDAEVQQLYHTEAPPIDLSTGLVAHYKMDGNANDASGNGNHGTAQNGLTFSTDRFGNSAQTANFDGIDDYISVNSSVTLESPSTAITITNWIKVSNSKQEAYYLAKTDRGTYNYRCGLFNEGMYLGKAGSQTNAYLFNENNPFPSTVWKMLSYTFDGQNVKFYMDGQLVKTIGDSPIISTSNVPLEIGRDAHGQIEWFQGEIDDIRIYNRALSDAEIQAIYQAEAPPVNINTGLVAHYKMDGNAQDASGNNNHGTAQNGVNFTTTTDRFGIAGKAAGFDGLDDKIYRNVNSDFYSSEKTFAMWAKIDGPGYANPRLVSVGPAGSSFQYYGLILEGTSPSRKLWFFTDNSVSNAYSNTLVQNDNEWRHFVITYNNNTVKIYIDGILDKQTITTGALNAFSSAVLQIGYSDNNSDWFQGALDDIRIYNRALNDTEIQAIYTYESSGIMLASPTRIGGGLTTLKTGTDYTFTAAIKNNKNVPWVGSIYRKVGNGTPLIINSNITISGGATYTINSNFIPQAVQIGQNIPITLLFKQGTGDFVTIGAINGAKNPVSVNIVSAISDPSNDKPFLFLNKSEASPGEVVVVSGGGFKPGTLVKLGYTPFSSGVVFPSQNATSEGSILFNFIIPSNFSNNIITFLANDIENKNPTAKMFIRQSEAITAQLEYKGPYVANQNIYISPNGKINLRIKDKLIKSSEYPLGTSSRSYKYLISFRAVNSPELSSWSTITDEKKGLINSEITENYDFLFTDPEFSIPGPGGSPRKLIMVIKDFYNQNRVVESPPLNIYVETSQFQVSNHWDRSWNDNTIITPKGVAADGVSRLFLKIKKTSAEPLTIQSVKVTLSSVQNQSDPTWLGKVKYSTNQNLSHPMFENLTTGPYSLEANGINTIVAQSNAINSNEEYWFWYVAPDDFQTATLFSNEVFGIRERYVTANFEITMSDNSKRNLPHNIMVVRPPLMMVHGWMGDENAFNKMDSATQFINGFYIKHRNTMHPYKSFDYNSQLLLDNEHGPSSFQNLIHQMRYEGFASNQVDYVSHSMGGLMLRNILSKKDTKPNSFENQFFQTEPSKIYPLKNYQKGWVHKYITINTPHFGSPGADLIAGALPLMNIVTTATIRTIETIKTEVQRTKNWLGLQTEVEYNHFSGVGEFNNSLFQYIPSPAVLNMQTNKYSGGETDFRALNRVKSHTIYSDVDASHTSLPSNNSFYNQLFLGMSDVYNIDPTTIALANVLFLVTRDLTIFKNSDQSLLGDFIQKNQEDLNSIWEPYYNDKKNAGNWILGHLIGLNPMGIEALTKTMSLWGVYNEKFSDFLWNGDIIVPTFSQTSGLPLNASNVSLLPNSKQVDFDNFHVDIQKKQITIDRVFQLLNSSVFSPLFGNLEANTNPQKTLDNNNTNAITNTETKGTSNIESNPREVYDKSKISIESPTPDFTINTPDILTIKVSAFDTVNLKRVELILGKDVLVSDTTLKNYYFNYSTDNFIENEKNQIMAVGYYLINNEIYTKLDTVSINVVSDVMPVGFKASPEIVELPLGNSFIPNYLVLYPSSVSFNIEKSKLNVEVSNTQCLSFSPTTGKFHGIGKGESLIIFTYDNSFKDTMYVAVGGGGLPYSQTIATQELNSSVVCMGQTTQIPFTTNGGTFDDANQFLVQLSDNTGENFHTIPNTNSLSPLSIKIPNDIEPGSGYKIRVVSTNVPVIGTVSPTTLTINSFGTPPTITANKTTFWSGENVILTASACPGGQTIKWSTGQTSSAITVTPIESVSYSAVCTNGICDTKASIPVFISKNYCPVDYIKNINTVSGENVYKASNSIQASHKISGSGTKETLEARSTLLKPGFEAQKGIIFTVQIGGCTN